ncbi:MAG: hypothetical protein WCJ75_13810 [Desulfomonile sp.]
MFIDYLDLGSPLAEIDELLDDLGGDPDEHYRVLIQNDESDPDLDFIVISHTP